MDSPSVKSLSQLFLVDSWSPVFGEVTRIAIIMFTTYFVGEMDRQVGRIEILEVLAR